MLKAGTRLFFCVIIGFTLSTCIDPYYPMLKGYESLLVVDGFISDANTSYTVKLSNTIQQENIDPFWIPDAIVFITDDNANSTYLHCIGSGTYKTDSIEFRGIPGRTYVLHILTNDGKEYLSDPCLMQPVSDIDSVYFSKDQELVNNGTESQDGIRIFLDSKWEADGLYYRWDYEETWKFKISTPKRFDYISINKIVPLKNVKQYCWKNRISDEILIHSGYSGQKGKIVKEPILFISSDESDRLMIEYSILVRQFSISKDEFEFWNNLKQVNESGGDIFASQPYSVISNIHSSANPEEKVLGYFQVSALKQKRIFIPFNSIVKMQLPFYHNNECERFEKSPGEFSTPFGPPVTFDDLYSMFCIKSDYVFIEPVYNQETHLIEKLVFARPECSSCEYTGTLARPDFWIDLN